jgi:Helicase HerA, central domain
MNEETINNLLLKLEPEFGTEKVENLRMVYQLGDDDRKARIEKIVSMAAKKLVNDNFLGNKVLLPPSTRQECKSKQEVYFGDVCYGDFNNQTRKLYPLYLDYEDIKNHTIITGLSGVGKTNTAYNLLIELASKGKNCIVFDWDRTWRNLLSLDKAKHPFVKDIQIYTLGRDEISGFAWNMFFDPPPQVKFSNWLGIVTGKPLQKSLLSGQGVSDFLENTAEELMNRYQHGMMKMLPNIEDIKLKVQSKFAQSRQLLWKQSTERVVRELTRESIKEVFGSRIPMDIPNDIIERQGVTIIEMDIETPEHLRILFQELLLTYFMLYYLHKGEAEKEELRTAIFLEEFPNMLPSSKIEKQTGSEIIKTLFKESRKFGVGLIAIAQESSELPNYVTANCKIQVHFALQTKKDIESSAGSLFLKKHEIPYIDYIWQGEAIVKVKGRVKNCLVKFPKAPIQRQITDEEVRACRQS